MEKKLEQKLELDIKEKDKKIKLLRIVLSYIRKYQENKEREKEIKQIELMEI